MSLKRPPGSGVITSLTRVPPPASDSSQRPDGFIEPRPLRTAGPLQASRSGGWNSLHSNVPSTPRFIL